MEFQKKRRERIRKKITFEEIKANIFLNFIKISKAQIQKSQCSPNRIETNKTTPGNIIKKLVKTKDKEEILKGTQSLRRLIP